MQNFNKGILQIHIAVFLFGFAGLFGKFTACSPAYVVLGRTFFAALALFIHIRFVSGRFTAPSDIKNILLYALQGILLGVHWWSFFISIKLSSVAVGLITFSTFPLFVTFFEPIVFREKIRIKEIFYASLVFIGVIFVIPDYNFSNNITKGAVFGIISGLTFAFLSIVNRSAAKKTRPVEIAFFQNFFAFIFLLFIIFAPFKFSIQGYSARLPSTNDIFLLFILGIVCTAFAHTMFIKALTGIKAGTAAIITALEPVYGIIMAFVFLKENPEPGTLIGGAIIIATCFLVSRKK